jgi:hypothetical protein
MSVTNKALVQDILENVTSQKSGEEDDWVVTNKASMDKAFTISPYNHPEIIICNPPGNQHQSICQSCSKGDSQYSL